MTIPTTKSILLYMESIGDARSFMSAAREVSFSKPIIVIKAGRSEAAAQAAASHTGAMTGSDECTTPRFAAAAPFGCETIAELFHMADVLGKQPRTARSTVNDFDQRGRSGSSCDGRVVSRGVANSPRCRSLRKERSARFSRHTGAMQIRSTFSATPIRNVTHGSGYRFGRSRK